MPFPRPAPLLILTLNSRFVPASRDDSYGFGVVGFVTAISSALAARDQLGGVVLYRRQPELSGSRVRPSSFLGLPACQIDFGDRVTPSARLRAFTKAVEMLRSSFADPRRPSVVYHQTDTLLDATPHGMAAMVTHHAPFASEICNLFGRSVAEDAFQGGSAKVDYLLAAQSAGLARLRRRAGVLSVELSGVQERVLRAAGVKEVERAAPPVTVGPLGPVQPVDGAACVGGLHLVSATARIDAFKNLRLLVTTANRLAAAGILPRLTLFVGGAEEHEAREVLRSELERELAGRACIEARLPHEELLNWFSRRRHNAIFVCSSIYETLGITPLEAILRGMPTLVPHSEHVGVSEFVESERRYVPTPDGLASAAIALSRGTALHVLGEAQRDYAVRLTGVERCVGRLCELAERAQTMVESQEWGRTLVASAVPSVKQTLPLVGEGALER